MLHGRPDGGLGGVPRRFALVHAPGMGGRKNWLLRLMRVQPVPEGSRHITGAGPGVSGQSNGQDLTAQFSAVAELAGLLTGQAAEYGGAVLDGELVALDGQGSPDFGLLQSALAGEPGPDGDPIELRLLLFDILQLGAPGAPDGARRSLLRTPYGERRAILGDVVGTGRSVTVPSAHTGILAQAERASRGLCLEGVVAKRVDSVRLPGRRGSAWIKLKSAADCSNAWWVTPRRVGEVAAAGRTRDGRLRQAVWRGWRPDTSAEEVRWES